MRVRRYAHALRRPVNRGFTLMEVMIALAILSMSMTVLLLTQSSSMDKISRARDLTVATLLARSKMIDAEQALFDEGFTEGESSEEGDFSEEGYNTFKWKTTYTPIELDLELESLCGLMPGGGGDEMDSEGDSCGPMLGAFMGPLDGILGNVAESMRLVEIEITWPTGQQYTESMKVSALLTRPDYKLGPS
mgnify:CR=1 FL=1|jgi:general secretion pathway protein I